MDFSLNFASIALICASVMSMLCHFSALFGGIGALKLIMTYSTDHIPLTMNLLLNKYMPVKI
jgi:hypothetical protein